MAAAAAGALHRSISHPECRPQLFGPAFRPAPVFNGLDLGKDETWEKLIDEIEATLRKLLE